MIKKKDRKAKKGSKKKIDKRKKITDYSFITTCCGAFIIISLTSLIAFNRTPPELTNTKVLGIESEVVEEKIYWTNFVKLYPTYRDGWLKLAKLEINLGNHKAASDALGKAKFIDPNNADVIEISSYLERNGY